jgi:predicted DNA-binding transcriptional regulator YafY
LRLDGAGPVVDAKTLLTLARAVRETERVTFAYDGPRGSGERRVEPYRLVATGRRWYLLAFDLDREDWRTFRLDRMSGVETRGWRFRRREAPDAAEYVQRAITQSVYDYTARVRIAASKANVEALVPPSVGTVTADGRHHCILATGGDDLEWMAMHLGRLPWEFEVLEPPELLEAMREMAER